MDDATIAPAPLRRCSRCGEHKPATREFFSPLIRKGRKPSWQPRCKVCRAAGQAAWRAADPERNRQRQQAWRDTHKANIHHQNQKWSERNRTRKNADQKVYALALRAEMLSAYGGRCACCGTDEARWLTLEHTRRDGAAHRKRLGGQAVVYLELRRLGWPSDGFTLLCWNCQRASAAGGACAHTADYRVEGRPAYHVLRAQLIAAYGGACGCCGLADARFLTLHHVNGDGREQRRRFPGDSFYYALRRLGWPKDGLGLLCWNCHLSLTLYGSCPHARATGPT